MAEIQPFRAYRYDTNRVALQRRAHAALRQDQPRMQEKYYAASPYNLIPVEKGRIFPDDTPQNNVYTRAAAKVEEWIAEKILLQDAAPSDLRLFAGISGAGNADAPRANWLHRAGPRGRLRREGRFPARAHAVGAEGRPHRVAAPHARADGPAFHALRRSSASRSTRCLKTAFAQTPRRSKWRDEFGVTHRLWPVSDAAFDRANSKRDGRQKADHRRRASSLRNGAELSQ